MVEILEIYWLKSEEDVPGYLKTAWGGIVRENRSRSIGFVDRNLGEDTQRDLIGQAGEGGQFVSVVGQCQMKEDIGIVVCCEHMPSDTWTGQVKSTWLADHADSDTWTINLEWRTGLHMISSLVEQSTVPGHDNFRALKKNEV